MGARGTGRLAGELMGTVSGLRRVVRRRLRTALPGRQLPSAQVELMLLVEARPGIGVSAAAQALGLAGNSVSTLVNALVDAGLLRRETDPIDRRAARLHLTAKARQRIARRRDARADLVGRAIEELSPADQQAISDALPALRRLLDTVREMDAEDDEEGT